MGKWENGINKMVDRSQLLLRSAPHNDRSYDPYSSSVGLTLNAVGGSYVQFMSTQISVMLFANDQIIVHHPILII
jgi:hypothetical protein